MSFVFKVTAAAVLLSAALPVCAMAEGFPEGYFKMTTMFREGNNECYEGNQRAGSMNGGSFMDSCQNVSGQLWKFVQ